MLLVNGREIPVAVVRSRRARRYVLRLRADGLARLTIPRSGSAKEAWEFAQRQGPWLERQLQYFASRPIRPREWRVGTEILFRGELVKIEIVSDSHLAADHPAVSIKGRSMSPADVSPSCRPSSPSVFASLRSEAGEEELYGDGSAGRTIPAAVESGGKLARARSRALLRQVDFFPQLSRGSAASFPDNSQSATGHAQIKSAIRFGDQVVTVADAAADLRPAIERHLRALAAKGLPARTFDLAGLHQLTVQRVSVRGQRSRWGSCSFKGVISLNWRLIQTPQFVSDYIILHELMHLRQMNHSARFWREVQRVCPDYRKAKMWLKQTPGLLDP
jgi:predicted metal-dependent hydrolase